jgi:cell division transport system ATP-binding protein
MIQLRNVSKCYPNGHVALNGISFDIANGEMVFLTGASGAGKTTLLKLLLAIEAVSNGHIFIFGKKINNISKRKVSKLRNSIGMIFQNALLLPEHSAFYNVAIPLILGGYKRKEIQQKVHSALDMVGLLHKANAATATMSSNEQQLVNIARAIVGFPSLILADEPFASLDNKLAGDIFELFVKLNKLGVTILIATHDLTKLDTRCGKILTLKQGQLVL